MAYIHEVCVAEEYRHRGIGTALMNSLQDSLQNEGVGKCFSLQIIPTVLQIRFIARQGEVIVIVVIYVGTLRYKLKGTQWEHFSEKGFKNTGEGTWRV